MNKIIQTPFLLSAVFQSKNGKEKSLDFQGFSALVRHQGLSGSAAQIRRPARASGVLGPEGSTGAFCPFGFESLILL
ncbi:MAG: hypothetical protein IKI65_01585 [Firmicutes bacterium]|nr:hypothetical protein [Bacillota bacterium]